ncbi:DUF6557 family protein [Desulfofundulus salinus]|uniref:Uncharacterized protein n=1 Tax=Desulfofundulus salinus TaxID=2419843 RepID=A0A494WYT2_9FIRM|nr:DUF6557 family protein [Desulfofundulus salinum]RKO67502.1 hypothetical protein D7024_11390 [Desulfofundulus salinum]
MPGFSFRTNALDFCLFREWAGFLVDEGLLRRMRLPEIAACVLWEMTFYGCLGEDILTPRREVEESLREYREHPERCVPLLEAFEKEPDFTILRQVS